MMGHSKSAFWSLGDADKAIWNWLSKPFFPKKVEDAIIKPDGSIIRTSPEDTIIATKNGFDDKSISLNPSFAGAGAGNDGEIVSILDDVRALLKSIESKTKKEVHAINHTSIESNFDPSNLMNRLSTAVI